MNARLLRIALWLALVALAGPVLYPESVRQVIGVVLSPTMVVEEGLLHSWGVLALCGVWIWLKRAAIWGDVERRPSWPFVLFGLISVAVSGWLFAPAAWFLGSVGLFALMFGRGAVIPALLFGVYCLAVLFPWMVEEVGAAPYAASVALPVTQLLQVLGFEVVRAGEELRLATAAGGAIRVTVSLACAGPVTMGLFVATFALMMIDTRLPGRDAAFLFVLGVAGTWVQSFARVVLLLLVGYYHGTGALWEMHEVLGYIMYSVWFLVFAHFYMRRARTLARRGRAGPALAAS